jgi:hypothetical protein
VVTASKQTPIQFISFSLFITTKKKLYHTAMAVTEVCIAGKQGCQFEMPSFLDSTGL